MEDIKIQSSTIKSDKKTKKKKKLTNAKTFSCCFSKDKDLKCSRKVKEKHKKVFKSSELQCVYDMMYDIKLSYPGDPVPRGPRHNVTYEL